MNIWLKKLLIANIDLVFELLHEGAKLTETKFDDTAIELLEDPVKEWVAALEVEGE